MIVYKHRNILFAVISVESWAESFLRFFYRSSNTTTELIPFVSFD